MPVSAAPLSLAVAVAAIFVVLAVVSAAAAAVAGVAGVFTTRWLMLQLLLRLLLLLRRRRQFLLKAGRRDALWFKKHVCFLCRFLTDLVHERPCRLTKWVSECMYGNTGPLHYVHLHAQLTL